VLIPELWDDSQWEEDDSQWEELESRICGMIGKEPSDTTRSEVQVLHNDILLVLQMLDEDKMPIKAHYAVSLAVIYTLLSATLTLRNTPLHVSFTDADIRIPLIVMQHAMPRCKWQMKSVHEYEEAISWFAGFKYIYMPTNPRLDVACTIIYNTYVLNSSCQRTDCDFFDIVLSVSHAHLLRELACGTHKYIHEASVRSWITSLLH
jgi:hypothetical protein